jgi:hypothetical protein
MNSPKHKAPRVEKVLVKIKFSDGEKIELVRLNSKIVVCQQVRTEKVYGIRYKGVMVFPPDSFEKASKYLWNEFLDP